MKLDRDENKDGLGKYAMVNLRKLSDQTGRSGPFKRWSPQVAQAIKTLEEAGALEWGRPGEVDEFFTIKLRDENAGYALRAYAGAVGVQDREYSEAIMALANRSGPNNPYCKKPD